MKILSYGSSSAGNCTIIAPDLMIDAGVNPRQIPEHILRQVDFCLITHEHGDHTKYIQYIRNKVIDIYATKGTLDKLEIKPDYRFHVIHSQAVLTVNGWKITPFASFHDASEPVNYLLQKDKEKIIFITDTCKAPWAVKGLTQIIIEANHDLDLLDDNLCNRVISGELFSRIMFNHLNISQTMDFLKTNNLSKVKGIYLAHLSKLNSDPKKFVKVIKDLTGIPTKIMKAQKRRYKNEK